MSWTVFVFVGAYPFKRGNPEPKHLVVFVDSEPIEARRRYHEEKKAYPEAHGMVSTEGSTKQRAWASALATGYILSPRAQDREVDLICKKASTLVLEKRPIGPVGDGLFCQGPCKSFCSYVEPNQADGTYICPNCRFYLRAHSS